MLDNAEGQAPELREYPRGGEDADQAAWLATVLERQFIYDHTAQRWHHWEADTGIWAPDQTQIIRHRVIELAQEAVARAVAEGVDEKLVKVYRRLFEKSRVDSALAVLSWDPRYATDGSDWDQNPYLLGCANGVVDLRDGTFVRPDPANLVSRSTKIAYNPEAECPRFAQFLMEITSGDGDLANFYMMWFGYSLFGLNEEQRFLIMTGLGRNGKGALVTSMRHVFGEYSAAVDANLYMKTRFGAARSDGPRADLMALKGRRLAVMSEPDGGEFNEELIKAHTGGDPITARSLYSNNLLTWTPTHSITFLTNRAPSVEDIGPAMAARVMVADFLERFDGEREDKQLYAKLEAEAEGILRYLVLAAGRWYASRDRGGLVIPQRIVDASAAYLQRNDPIGQALTEAFVIEEAAHGQSRVLYKAYLDWFDESDREGEPLSEVMFADSLKRKGFTKKKTSMGMVWLHIRPKGVMEAALEDDDGEE